jgi:hypothetical protein
VPVTYIPARGIRQWARLAGLPLLVCANGLVKILLMKKNLWRAVTETGFIIFLFYSNLLMGEFTRAGMGQGRGFVWAIRDIFTAINFGIATIAALIGYVLVEFVRNRL